MQKGTVVVCADYDASAPRIIAASAYDPAIHTLWKEPADPRPVVPQGPVPAEPLRWFEEAEAGE